jgi:hypothetical protein
MRITFDRALMSGLVLCYALGILGAADRVSGIAAVLLAVLAVRLVGSTITWIITGR